MSLIVFSVVAVVDDRPLRAMVLLLASAITHAGLTIQSAFLIGLYWLSIYGPGKNRELLIRCVVLAIVGVACLLPSIMLSLESVPKVPISEWMSAVYTLDHAVPWNSTRWMPHWPLRFLYVFILVFMAFQQRASMHVRYTRLWVASFVGCVFLGVLQPVGVGG